MTKIISVLEICISQVMPTTMDIIDNGQLGVTSMSGPYGAFVAVLDDAALERTLVHEADLYPILDKARKLSCHWIHFDRDADVDPELPDFLEHWT